MSVRCSPSAPGCRCGAGRGAAAEAVARGLHRDARRVSPDERAASTSRRTCSSCSRPAPRLSARAAGLARNCGQLRAVQSARAGGAVDEPVQPVGIEGVGDPRAERQRRLAAPVDRGQRIGRDSLARQRGDDPCSAACSIRPASLNSATGLTRVHPMAGRRTSAATARSPAAAPPARAAGAHASCRAGSGRTDHDPGRIEQPLGSPALPRAAPCRKRRGNRRVRGPPVAARVRVPSRSRGARAPGRMRGQLRERRQHADAQVLVAHALAGRRAARSPSSSLRQRRLDGASAAPRRPLFSATRRPIAVEQPPSRSCVLEQPDLLADRAGVRCSSSAAARRLARRATARRWAGQRQAGHRPGKAVHQTGRNKSIPMLGERRLRLPAQTREACPEATMNPPPPARRHTIPLHRRWFERLADVAPRPWAARKSRRARRIADCLDARSRDMACRLVAMRAAKRGRRRERLARRALWWLHRVDRGGASVSRFSQAGGGAQVLDEPPGDLAPLAAPRAPRRSAMASRGMPNTTQLASSCAKLKLPASRIRASRRRRRRPMPVSEHHGQRVRAGHARGRGTARRPRACGGSPARRPARARCSSRRCAHAQVHAARARCRHGRQHRSPSRSPSATRMRHRPSSRAA